MTKSGPVSFLPMPEHEANLPPDPDAGFGGLRTERGYLPLQAMDVRARIDGLLAEVTLSQTFVNAYVESLEATYIFPLPDRAAVTAFRLEVAGRVVEAELKERGAAREEYDEALKQGHRAAIAEEERSGVFTLLVGNLPAGEAATVRLTLTGPLLYDQGEATFRFPLVVAPRYIPGTPLPGPCVGDGVAADTDGVPDASRITPPVLLPGYPYPVRLTLSAELLPGLPASGAGHCSFPVAEETLEESGIRRLVLRPGERANRDFILRFPVAETAIRTSLSLQADREGGEGTFVLTLVPPANALTLQKPRDVVFVLDRSGSMGGWKMLAARRALGRMIDTLNERDRFTVLAFDDTVESPPHGSGLISATDRQRFRALEFLGTVEARGGTEMARPLDLAVTQLQEPRPSGGEAPREAILVLVTDGQVGNEDQILKLLGKRLQGLRIFTLGIDQAVNEGFLKRLALLGGGFCELVESEDRLDEVMAKLHRRIAAPQLTGLKVEAAGLRLIPSSTVPGRLPDLFAGAPLQIFGRYQGASAGDVQLNARDAAGRPWSLTVASQVSPAGCVGAAWGRAFLRELEDRYVLEPQEALARQIVQTSLKFGVLCRFTAFVAVDRVEKVSEGGPERRIVQPVEAPAGWAMVDRDNMSLIAALGGAGQQNKLSRVRKARCQVQAAPLDEFLDCTLREEADGDYQRLSPAPPPASLSPRSGALLGPLLGKVRSLFEKTAAPERAASPAPSLDLTAYRKRAADLLFFLDQARQAPANAGHELDVLAERLAALIEDLTSVGATGQETATLQKLLENLRNASQLDAAQLAQLCDEAEAVLRSFAGLSAALTPERAKFWA